MDSSTYSRIREIRESLKMSGTRVAKQLNITPQYYYDIERGKRGLSAEIVSQLVDIFQVSADYLLGKSDHNDYADQQASQDGKAQHSMGMSFYGGSETYTADEIEVMEAALKAYREQKKKLMDQMNKNH